MRTGLFIDDSYKREIDKEGYVKIPYFINESIRQQIIDYYFSLNINNDTDCLSASIVLTEEQNTNISNYLSSLLITPLEKHFVDFTLNGASFLIKKKRHPELQLHQDFTNINEDEDILYNVWIPLSDVNKDNGSMFVIPKSHLYFNNYISQTIPGCLIDRQLVIDKYIKDISMAAGEALIFTNRLLHGSYRNSKNEDRIILILSVTNKNPKFVYYHKKNNNTVSRYIVDPKNYINLSEDGLPLNAVFDKDIAYNFSPLDVTALYKKLLLTDNILLIKMITFYKRVIRWIKNQ